MVGLLIFICNLVLMVVVGGTRLLLYFVGEFVISHPIIAFSGVALLAICSIYQII